MQSALSLTTFLAPPLHPVALLIGVEVNCDVCPSFVSLTPDQAADDHVKIKITKYKAGGRPGGEVKVQELGEADPQWKHIKDVVKEQLEKAGLKAEGTSHSLPSFSPPLTSNHSANTSYSPER